MSTELSEIRAALAAATPGPWQIDYDEDPDDGSDGGYLIHNGPEASYCYQGPDLPVPNCDADALLIAAAPAWLAELADRVEEAEHDRDAWRETAIENEQIADDYRRHADAMIDKRREVEAAIGRVRALVAQHPGSHVSTWRLIEALDGAE